jgi:sortase A
MDILDVEDGYNAERLQVAELDGAYYMGVLTIPALEKILPIQSDWSMEKLKTSPCRYSGTLQDGEFVIAGHNYKRHFSGLSTLPIGEKIVFTDLEGKQTFFEVKDIYTVAATNIEGMVNSGYDLSLFTCNYGGKARVTVRCERVAAPEA